MTAASTMTTKDFAAALSTDPKTVRKYLRSVTPKDDQPGKGSRWELAGTKTAIAKHRKGFAAWQQEELKRAADRAAKVAEDLKGRVEDSEDPAEVLIEGDEDSDEDIEPSSEEIEAILQDADED